MMGRLQHDFLDQQSRFLGSNSRLPGIATWKRYLSSQQSSVSHSIKIVPHKKSCQYRKSPKSPEIRTGETREH